MLFRPHPTASLCLTTSKRILKLLHSINLFSNLARNAGSILVFVAKMGKIFSGSQGVAMGYRKSRGDKTYHGVCRRRLENTSVDCSLIEGFRLPVFLRCPGFQPFDNISSLSGSGKEIQLHVSVHTSNNLDRLCAIMLVFLACVLVDSQVPERDRALFSGADWQEHQGYAMKIAVGPD